MSEVYAITFLPNIPSGHHPPAQKETTQTAQPSKISPAQWPNPWLNLPNLPSFSWVFAWDSFKNFILSTVHCSKLRAQGGAKLGPALRLS